MKHPPSHPSTPPGINTPDIDPAVAGPSPSPPGIDSSVAGASPSPPGIDPAVAGPLPSPLDIDPAVAGASPSPPDISTPDIDPAVAGALLGGLSAPLAAVSTRYGDTVNAQIAVAIAPASIVPHRPRLIVQLYHTNYTCHLVAAAGVMAVNFLNYDQLPLVWQLGMHSGRHGNKLAGIPYQTGVTGSPLLAGCFGYLDCRVVNAMDGGDMTAFLVEALAAETASAGSRRMTWREARPRLPQRWAAEWERKIAAEMALSQEQMGQINPAPWQPMPPPQRQPA